MNAIDNSARVEACEEVKQKIVCTINFNAYFEQDEIGGKSLTVIDIGVCDFPTGSVVASDPFEFFVDEERRPYLQKVPVGRYRAELCVVKSDGVDSDRYAAVRLRFTRERAVEFRMALTGEEDLSLLDDGGYFGFGVDAAMGAVYDKKVYDAYCKWYNGWNESHKDGDIYEACFEALFKENYRKHPEYQCAYGDWLNFQVPGTDYHIPIFNTGFGDGVYPVYWGVDKNGDICQMVVHLIDIETVYGSEGEESDQVMQI